MDKDKTAPPSTVGSERASSNPRARRRCPARARIDITQPIDHQPAYLRFADVAALLGKSVRTISSWEQRGLLRVLRPAGGTPVVQKSEIERLLREGVDNG